ncbi:ribonuclease P protein component [Rhodoferax sp.]|uniref:ribonuclease P protein component n=1 Tax=Rhodoferax sp. TaxID=50421 RepID=UPI0027292F3C|nr:ribonuclease P protein component [Rhodoferax sp.]MDO9197065.1 ribonuclease P protein component [Rhodoferax sp.]
MQRLKTRSQFQAVLAGGTVGRTPHFALHRASLEAPVVMQKSSAPAATPVAALFVVHDLWMGAMVPKRWAKRAVTRNAIKRQIYSVSADFDALLPVAAHVVRLRASFDRKEFTSATSDVLKAAVRHELQQLFAGVTARSTATARQDGAT